MTLSVTSFPIYFRKRIPGPFGNQPAIPAYKWYVDSVNGSDTNTGESETEAFQTIAKLLTVWQPEQSVGFARGSHWREGMNIALDGVGLYAYGTGAAPILDGSDVIDNATFSLSAGKSFTYEKTITFDSPGLNTWLNLFEDDNTLTYQTSSANVESNPGSYYVTSHTAGTATLYVHATDSSDVSTNNKIYEFNKRTDVLDFYDSANVTVDVIETRRSNNNNGSFVAGRGATASNCTWRDGTKHNAFFRQDTVVTDCQAIDAYYGSQGSSMVVVADTSPSGATVSFTRVDCTMTTYDATVSGFFWEVVVGGSYVSITFDGCECTNVTTAFSGSGALAVNVTDSPASGGARGAQINDSNPWIIDNCLWKGTNDAIVAINAANANVTVRNGSDLESSHASPLTVYGTNNGISVTVEDSTIRLSNANAVGIYLTGAGISITNNRNLFAGPGDLILGDVETGAGGDTYVGDNNHYADATPRFRWAGAFVDFATWKTNTGQDANSTAG